MMVSIITPTYNAAQFIEQAYACILEQTVNDWEWLVTDDCSTDETYRLLQDFAAKDHRIKIQRNPIHSGAAVARNNSLARVTGKYIAFLDADDIWIPKKLETQLTFMGENINFSFSAYEIINEKGKPLNKFIDLNKNKRCFSYADMLNKKATLGCSTVILRRSAFFDLQMPLLYAGQDYAFWLKLLKHGEYAHLVNEAMTKYRIVRNSLSRNKFMKAKIQLQIYRKIERIGLIETFACFVNYAFRAVFR